MIDRDGADFDLGVMGTLARPVAIETIAASDCVIAFGASLSRLTTDREALIRGKRVVQVLADPLENDRRTDHGLLLIADPVRMADRMVAVLDEAEIPPSGAAGPDLAEALANEAASYAADLPFAATAPGTVDHEPTLRRLDQLLPKDRILVADLGRFVPGVWRQMGVSHPRHLVYSCNFGGIGCGTAEAIGAARAAGLRRTVLVAGDGGFMLGGLTELATIHREKLNLTIILCNDGSYGAEHIQFTNKGLSPALSMTAPPDFTALAMAIGLPAMRITSVDELTAALDWLPLQSGPCLLELRLDPDLVMMD